MFYSGLEFQVAPGVYEPAEDTFLIADNLDARSGERVLDLGTGCGILGILSALRGARVLATDIDPASIRCAKRNAERHGVAHRMEFRRGDLFDPVGGETFDLILFNPPYLPRSGRLDGDPVGRSCEGGPDGRAVIERFLNSVCAHLHPGGRLMLVQSSLSAPELTAKRLFELGFRVETVEKSYFFERLVLFKATKRI